MSKEKEIHNFIKGILGGFAASTADLCSFPIDSVKTRMQMYGKQGMPQYKNSLDCIRITFRTEGCKGFYRGLSANICRQMTYSTLRCYIYNDVKKWSKILRNKISKKQMKDTDEVSLLEKFIAGGLGGAIGIMIGNPFDVYKIRLINDVDLKKPKYNGLLDVMKKSWVKEGIKGLWKGINVNIMRSFLLNAAELSAYDYTKVAMVRKLNMHEDSKITHLLSSLVAGFMAAVFSQPADVIKTRYMNQVEASIDKNLFRCFLRVYKEQGFLAFYKGFVPQYMRLSVWTTVMFMSWEHYQFMYKKIMH